MFKELKILLYKEFILEWRLKSGLQSILLYTVSTIFLCYWAIHKIGPEVWVALFWIIMVFSSLNAVGRSFLQESAGQQLYFYGTASPNAILFAKMIFNAMIMSLLSLVLILFYSLTLGFPILQKGPFFLTVFLGMLGISGAFTFLSAIASKASGSLTLLAILGIPILLPILFLVIHLSINHLALGEMGSNKDLWSLLLINLIIPSVAALVFPYIWRQ